MPHKLNKKPSHAKALILRILGLVIIVTCSAKATISTPELVAASKPAIVLITTYDVSGQVQGLGTGFLYQNYRVATNAHVIKGAAYVRITTITGIDYRFMGLLAYNAQVDLAILAVDATGPCLALADSNQVQEGQHILVIGNPDGLYGTVSDGMISAIRHNPDAIQITAPISHGSSGSPVLNEQGLVIGIVAGFDSQGQNLNFAIPSAEIDHVAKVGNLYYGSSLWDYSQQPINPAPRAEMVQTEPQQPQAGMIPPQEIHQQIANLVLSYMTATQNGKPVSLAPYCTTTLLNWYGKKGLSMQEAEQDIAKYYRTWPRQRTRFNASTLQILTTEYKDTYVVTLPFEWAATNNKKAVGGKSMFCATIVLTSNGYGYRICSAINQKMSTNNQASSAGSTE